MTITIIGNVASGKSTAMPIIAECIGAQTLDADNLFQTTDPFAQDYLKDTARWAFSNELWLTYERVKLIESAISHLEKQHLCIDSGLLMSWVYTNSHYQVGNITKAEWELYQQLYARLSQNILGNSGVVLLSYTVETLMQRIINRGVKYELEYYNSKYLKQLNRGLKNLQEQLQLIKVPVLLIKEGEVSDFQHSPDDRERFISLVQEFVHHNE